MNLRPSELYGITWPLAAFYLDRGLNAWASFVENKMNEAAEAVANTVVGRGSSGQVFIISARKRAFARLLGLSENSAYRQPQLPGMGDVKDRKTKRTRAIPAEGKFDLSRFNA